MAINTVETPLKVSIHVHWYLCKSLKAHKEKTQLKFDQRLKINFVKPLLIFQLSLIFAIIVNTVNFL